MSSASRVPGVEIRGRCRVGDEPAALADDVVDLVPPAHERLA